MTPKEKAKELVDKFDGDLIIAGWGETAFIDSKQCAIIAVDQVKWFHERLFYLTEGSLFDKYLNDVKQEIKKL